MKLTTQFSLRIAEPTANSSVSRARKQFNTLIKKLEAARLRLAGWTEAMPAILRQAEKRVPAARTNLFGTSEEIAVAVGPDVPA